MSNAFELSGVVKHYGSVKALDGVTIKAEEGKVFGLLVVFVPVSIYKYKRRAA